MRLALAQMNSIVGDLDGNRDRILARLEEARQADADLVLFPELAVTGYPPEDLLLSPALIRAARRTLEEIAAKVQDTVALVGAPTSTRISTTAASCSRTARSAASTASACFRTTASS